MSSAIRKLQIKLFKRMNKTPQAFYKRSDITHAAITATRPQPFMVKYPNIYPKGQDYVDAVIYENM